MNALIYRRSIFLILLAVSVISFTVIEDITYSQNTELKGLKHVSTTINFSAGSFTLNAGDGTVAVFKSVFTNPEWKAAVDFDAAQETFSIKQPGDNMNAPKKFRNDWDIKLPRSIPMDLKLNMGAGDAEIDLSNTRIETMKVKGGAGGFNLNLANTSLSDLKVDVGTGGLKIDLSGKHDKDLSADISNGVGGVRLFLPENIGVRVKVSSFFGLDRGEFRKKDGYLVNSMYGKTKVSLDIRVKSGVGGVMLKMK